MRAIVSADRLTAAGMAVFTSTGYREDGTPYERPGRATVVPHERWSVRSETGRPCARKISRASLREM
jgi:hypothetical protein